MARVERTMDEPRLKKLWRKHICIQLEALYLCDPDRYSAIKIIFHSVLHSAGQYGDIR